MEEITHRKALTVNSAGQGGTHASTGTGAPSTEPAPITFTEEAVSAEVNRAADDILEAVNASDVGLRDAINLLVNAALAYLTGQAQDLRGVVEENYDASYAEVLSWIEEVA
jgi:hypothetical protein